METTQEDSTFTFTQKEIERKRIITVSAVAFDFDFVTSGSDKSRADEIRVLIVKNRKPPRKSKEGKPGGRGLPTGQVDQNEDIKGALAREVWQESGYKVKRFVGELFVTNKLLRIGDEIVPNDIHIFLAETHDLSGKVTETDEIDASVDPWISLREVFQMPLAQDRGGVNKNPNGIYFSHLKRLYDAIESMVYHPEDLIDGEAIEKWLNPNRKILMAAMADLAKEELFDRLFSSDESAH